MNDLSRVRTLTQLQQHIYKALVGQLESEDQFEERQDIIARVVLEGPCPLYTQLCSQTAQAYPQEENIQILEEYLYDAMSFRYVEVVPDGLVRPVVPQSYRGQPHVLATALDIIEEARKDPQVLLKLKPDMLAGFPGGDTDDVIVYLRELLEGLDYEIATRMMEETS